MKETVNHSTADIAWRDFEPNYYAVRVNPTPAPVPGLLKALAGLSVVLWVTFVIMLYLILNTDLLPTFFNPELRGYLK